ncbi:MAG: hypothetical protein WD757_05875 [Actinomycetota bacterium]
MRGGGFSAGRRSARRAVVFVFVVSSLASSRLKGASQAPFGNAAAVHPTPQGHSEIAKIVAPLVKEAVA